MDAPSDQLNLLLSLQQIDLAYLQAKKRFD